MAAKTKAQIELDAINKRQEMLQNRGSYSGAIQDVRAQKKLKSLQKTIKKITGKSLSETQMSVKEARTLIKNFKRDRIQTKAYDAMQSARTQGISVLSVLKNGWRGLSGNQSLQDELMQELIDENVEV